MWVKSFWQGANLVFHIPRSKRAFKFCPLIITISICRPPTALTTFPSQTDRDQKQIGVQSARQINCNYPAVCHRGNGANLCWLGAAVWAKCKALNNSIRCLLCAAMSHELNQKVSQTNWKRKHKWDTLLAGTRCFRTTLFLALHLLCFSAVEKRQEQQDGEKLKGKSGNNNNGKGLLNFPAESESNFRSLNLHFEIKFFTLEKLAASNIFILPQTRRNYAPSVGVSGCARTWQLWPTRNRNQATPEPGR